MTRHQAALVDLMPAVMEHGVKVRVKASRTHILDLYREYLARRNVNGYMTHRERSCPDYELVVGEEDDLGMVDITRRKKAKVDG